MTTFDDLPLDTIPDLGTGWCPICRGTRTIVDHFPDSTLAFGREDAVAVTVFDCGHDVQRDHGSTEGPGAPYAGTTAELLAAEAAR